MGFQSINEGLSDSCAFSWALFLLFVLFNSNVLVSISSYFILLLPIEAYLFPKERQKDGEELGGG